MTDGAYNARDHYRGEVAVSYLRRRTGQRKWGIEQRTFYGLIGGLPTKSSILDMPVGTGRFLDIYRRTGHPAVGLDISPDMLSQIRLQDRNEVSLVRGDAEDLPFEDSSIDCVVSARFLNLVPPPVFTRAITEMGRVARERLLLEVRVAAEATLGRRLWGALGELVTHPVSTAARLSQPLRTTADKHSVGSGYFIHPERELDLAIAQAGLAIDRVVHLGDGSAYNRRLLRFTPLRIYVLEKRTKSGPPSAGPTRQGEP